MNRLTYLWLMLLLFVAVPAAEWSVLQVVPALEGYLPYINAVCLVALAVFTDQRLMDAGYRRWIGIAGVLICAMLGPFITIVIALSLQPVELPLVLMAVGTGWLFVLIGFVIWAGVQRTAAKT